MQTRLLILTSGWSLTGTYTFSDRVNDGPWASGSCKGSLTPPLMWNKLDRTLLISVKKKGRRCYFLVIRYDTARLRYSISFRDISSKSQSVIMGGLLKENPPNQQTMASYIDGSLIWTLLLLLVANFLFSFFYATPYYRNINESRVLWTSQA